MPKIWWLLRHHHSTSAGRGGVCYRCFGSWCSLSGSRGHGLRRCGGRRRLMIGSQKERPLLKRGLRAVTSAISDGMSSGKMRLWRQFGDNTPHADVCDVQSGRHAIASEYAYENCSPRSKCHEHRANNYERAPQPQPCRRWHFHQLRQHRVHQLSEIPPQFEPSTVPIQRRRTLKHLLARYHWHSANTCVPMTVTAVPAVSTAVPAVLTAMASRMGVMMM
mmetsp:Transcript_11601/g.25076  ORF Transcript_11601/g.25076 Transcript_11601/m.25076 type:complete len:220 (+) Transcript_11601:2307-2966(+)